MSRCTNTLIASYVWTLAFLFVKGILPTCNMIVAVSSGRVSGMGNCWLLISSYGVWWIVYI